MTLADHPQPRTSGMLAVLQALVAQLLAMLRGAGSRREIVQRLVTYETQLILALFGGGLASDPDFLACSPEDQRVWRRGYARDLASLRSLRLKLQRAATLRGRGYRRMPVLIIKLRFERRIAQRRVRRLACARLAFVASTREVRAGAPP